MASYLGYLACPMLVVRLTKFVLPCDQGLSRLSRFLFGEWEGGGLRVRHPTTHRHPAPSTYHANCTSLPPPPTTPAIHRASYPPRHTPTTPSVHRFHHRPPHYLATIHPPRPPRHLVTTPHTPSKPSTHRATPSPPPTHPPCHPLNAPPRPPPTLGPHLRRGARQLLRLRGAGCTLRGR